MNRQKWIILLAGLGLIGATAALMQPMKANQKLGRPGVKTTALTGTGRLNICLPEKVSGYNSTSIDTDKAIMEGLPHDTSFGQRIYYGSSLTNLTRVVLMGTDRTSIHKPEFCLEGQGWNISDAASSKDVIHVAGPAPYDLPVMRLVTTKEVMSKGVRVPMRGIYVYWFVADGDLTNDHAARMRNSAWRLLRRGELERWAYVSCFAVCAPGTEAATYEQMKSFIAVVVPEFQLVGPDSAGVSPQTTAR